MNIVLKLIHPLLSILIIFIIMITFIFVIEPPLISIHVIEIAISIQVKIIGFQILL